MAHRIGFIGTGAEPDDPGVDGYAMAYKHAAGYQQQDDCELVACADIVRENAEAFAAKHGIVRTNVYEDYTEMLADADLDVVSVCTPPSTHADLVIGTARSGAVDAIHCEKPMADTWEDCQEMVRVCDEADVQLTINHQKRFGKPFQKTKALIENGTIGGLQRLEFGDSTLYDMGTHLFDLCNFFNGDVPIDWVLAQIDYSEENLMFGTHNENQAIAQWRYENGVYGLASTGRGDPFLDCYFRVVGSSGVIEIGGEEAILRYRTEDSGWTTVDTGRDSIHGPYSNKLHRTIEYVAKRVPGRLEDRVKPSSYIERAIDDVLTSLENGERSQLAAANALPAQEAIFACWESSRRRGRVEPPLDIGDNPLESMVEAGELEVTSD